MSGEHTVFFSKRILQNTVLVLETDLTPIGGHCWIAEYIFFVIVKVISRIVNIIRVMTKIEVLIVQTLEERNKLYKKYRYQGGVR